MSKIVDQIAPILQLKGIKMDQQKASKPILIYFKTRGMAQIIRSVLLQIGVDFEEKFIPFRPFDDTILKEYKIQVKNLPCLVHGGKTITGVFPIIKYCCNYFERSDLLGITMDHKIQITQLMCKALSREGIILHTLFKGLKQIREKKSGKEGIEKLKAKIIEVAQTGKFLPHLAQMFKKSGKFIYGYLTVVDFFLYQKAFHCKNILSCNEFSYAKFATAFAQFFESTQFYKKHSETLSQYKVFFPEIDEELNQILKEMWRGDPKFITCD